MPPCTEETPAKKVCPREKRETAEGEQESRRLASLSRGQERERGRDHEADEEKEAPAQLELRPSLPGELNVRGACTRQRMPTVWAGICRRRHLVTALRASDQGHRPSPPSTRQPWDFRGTLPAIETDELRALPDALPVTEPIPPSLVGGFGLLSQRHRSGVVSRCCQLGQGGPPWRERELGLRPAAQSLFCAHRRPRLGGPTGRKALYRGRDSNPHGR